MHTDIIVCMEVMYFDGFDVACVDGYSFRRDKKTGYFLSAKPIGDRRKRLHVYIWEKHNGRVPKGYHVHHVDKDKNNNEISNLMLMDEDAHAQLHGDEMPVWRRQKAREDILNAGELAKEWHGSSDGRKWHSLHAKQQWEQAEPSQYKCDWCGSEFESLKRYSESSHKFCSNRCKANFRRHSGVDDIVKKCESCGGEYVSNKYQKTKYCEVCKNHKD